jgi:glycine cleavage system H lipoate-binding protein
MKCPFSEEITMMYCNACTAKKKIPKDQLMLQNPCEADYSSCPVFVTFSQETTKEQAMVPKENKEISKSETGKPCIWMKAGVIAYRMCTRNYDCKNCEFDQAIMDQGGSLVETPLITQAIAKLRQLPATDRKCRYMLTGDFSYKICPNNYECWHCPVDQYVQDTIDASPYLQKRRAKLEKREKKVKGFIVKDDRYYLPNHIWLKVEEEVVKVGIDDFAVRLIGRIEKIDFPEIRTLNRDSRCWTIGAGNRLAAMSLPIAGEIVETNNAVKADPSMIQRNPYDHGWLMKIKPSKNLSDIIKGAKVEEWIDKEFENLHQEFESSIGVTISDGGDLADDLYERLSDESWYTLIKRFLW